MRFTGDIHKDMMCSCCQDKNRARRFINDTQRDIQYINRLIGENNIKKLKHSKEYKEIYNDLRYYRKHINFMCGHCIQVDNYTIDRASDKFNESIAGAILYLKDNKAQDLDKTNRIKHDLLRMLQGDYPSIWRMVDDI